MRYLFLLLLLVTLPAHAVDLTACGNITSTGTYVLQNDVTADGTCFYVTANDVTLDLNGRTVTYDNAAPFTIANGSFETASLTDWDLTSAPAAVRTAGVYTESTVYDGTYALQLPMPLAQDQTIRTVGTYNLTGGVSYAASVMMWEPYNMQVAGNTDIDMFIDIVAASDNSILASKSIRSLWTSYTARGFQHVAVAYTPAGNTSVKVQLRAVGGSTAVASGKAPFGALYFDQVKLHQTDHWGIKFGNMEGTTWGKRGKVTSSAVAKGKVVQGQSKGNSSPAIGMLGIIASDLLTATVEKTEVTVYGTDSYAIEVRQSANIIISDNIIHGYADTTTSRDGYTGALIRTDRADAVTAGVAGKIYNNVITHGVQTGIYVAGSPDITRMTEVYGNDITLQSKYTNDFGVVGGVAVLAANIHDNIIRCASGNDTCRGIIIHGGNGIIKDNTIDVHYRLNNQEYLGCGGAAYGIQLDVDSNNSLITGNTVTAYADECEAAAFRFYSSPGDTLVNNVVQNNTFTSITTGTQLASVLRILLSEPDELTFTNNILSTNSAFIYFDGQNKTGPTAGLTLDSNTYQISYPKSAIYYPLVTQSTGGGTFAVPVNVHLTNNTYADSTVRADIAPGTFNNINLAYAVDPYPTGTLITELGVATTVTPSVNAGRYTTSRLLELTATGATIKYCLSAGCTPSSGITYSAPFKILQNIATQTVRTQADSGVVTELIYRKQRRK